MNLEAKRFVGYMRVSTAEQGESGAGLAAQETAIRAWAEQKGVQIVQMYTEVASGAKGPQKRPEFAAALKTVQDGIADGIVAAKLDRLSRSSLDFANLIDLARRKNFAVVVLDLQMDMSTPIGEMIASVVAAMAQFERRLIGQRTKDALAERAAAGVRIGRPRYATVPHTLYRQILAAREQGMSYRTIATILNDEQIPGPGGGRWHKNTVKRAEQGGYEVTDLPPWFVGAADPVAN